MSEYVIQVFAIQLHPLTQVFLILAVVCLLLSILLFIVLHIPRTFGELTGYTERKQVSKFSKQNRLTSEFSKELRDKNDLYTAKISAPEKEADEREEMPSGAPTELLKEAGAENETQVLNPDPNGPEFAVVYSLQFSESKNIIP
jgi:hypothetical protein